MTTIHLERSDAMASNHNLDPGTCAVSLDTTDGKWVQITYESVRTQDGAPLVTWDGAAWWYDGQPWSDIIFDFS